MDYELVMYTRTLGCPYVRIAKRVLQSTGVPYREINIDRDADARARLLDWVGFLSVPTLIVAEPGADLPAETPAPLPDGARSPRGIDRGTMLTEPSADELTTWLIKTGFITVE